MTPLDELTAVAAAAAIRKGELSSEELVAACLDRIARLEPELGAWAHLDPAHALAQARAADEARREGKGTGPLHGVPIGVKDIIDTADQPTEHGSPCSAGGGPSRRGLRRRAARGRRRDPRQDGDDRARAADAG